MIYLLSFLIHESFFNFTDVAGSKPELTNFEAQGLQTTSEAKTDADDFELIDSLLCDYQLSPPLSLKEIKKEDIGGRGQNEVILAFNTADFSGNPFRESRACREVTVGALSMSLEIIKLQLERPGRSAISSLPEVVRSSPFLAKIQRKEPRAEVAGESRDLIVLLGPDLVATIGISSDAPLADAFS